MNDSWKEGINYLNGQKVSGFSGATLRSSAYVASMKDWTDDAGLTDMALGLGFGIAAARNKAIIPKESSGLKFDDIEKLENHFTKHGGEFKGAYSNINEYLKGANNVIKNGEKVQYNYTLKDGTTELRTGYVKFMGNTSKGKAKFEFVGTNLSGDITTYHVKRGEDVYKLLNGNKHINVINPIE